MDPPGCTDIDDALHCRELENGNIEVLFLLKSTQSFIYLFLPLFYEQCTSGNSK